MILATVVPKYNGAVFQALSFAIPEGVTKGLADGGEIVRMNAMSNMAVVNKFFFIFFSF